MKNKKGKKFSNGQAARLWLPGKGRGAIALLFLLFIWLPLFDGVFNIVRPFALIEKRKLAEKPVFNLSRPFSFAKKYEDYYNDHFTFRTRWVYLNNLLTYLFFHASASAKVVIGKEEWLFLGNYNKFFDEIDYYRNLEPFTVGELRYWQVLLEERRNWLKRRGIHYIFTIAPNKSTIYPEFMPDSVKKINPRSRLDQLIAHLEKYSTLRILDLRPALREAKKIRPTYHRTDTHWNDWGAYVAYHEIIRSLQPHFAAARPRSLERYHFQPTEFRDGDLALMLTLPDIFRETHWRITAKFPLQARAQAAGERKPQNERTPVSVHACASGPLPAALLVHDSFAFPMKQFLSEEFSKTIYIWDWDLNFFDRTIEEEGVKIVIEQMVEYSLLNRVPVNPPPLHR